ncbi:MAG: hypothetical protein JWR26_750 [Pedosphaera sp.]|nr:hypothetical protein [Pedosphaera sp.]
MALGLVLLALGIGTAIEPLLGYRPPMSLFVAASLGAAWYGGLGPGLLALVAGFLVGDFFFVPPLHRLGSYSTSDFALLMGYSIVSSIGLAAINNLHQARRREEKDKELNKELERRVRERTAELEAFCYSVSHDLRSPLRSIASFTQILKEEHEQQFDPESREMVQFIIESAQRMDRLILDLLDLSRLSRTDMEPQSVDLSAMAEGIVAAIRQTDPTRAVDFVIAPHLVAMGDKELLHIVLENLIENAWKFIDRRQRGRIEFGIEQQPDGRQAYFVRDNGAGFDMAYAGKLFGVFERLHNSAEFPGNGIGLAMVRRIIERHGGSVWATGALNQGATFYFTLPGDPGDCAGKSP